MWNSLTILTPFSVKKEVGACPLGIICLWQTGLATHFAGEAPLRGQ